MRTTRPARTEPLIWLLFTVGGGVAAFLFPVHIVILGLAHPAGLLPEDALSYDRVAALVRNPLTRVYLGVLVVLPLYHAAHRIRYGIRHELRMKEGKRIVATVCYGAAVVGTALAAWALLRI